MEAVAGRLAERGSEGVLVSNDQADYVLVACRLCQAEVSLTRGPTPLPHTRSPSASTRGGLGPSCPSLRQSGQMCGELVLLDNDAIAVHLRRSGHPKVTHKVYNITYIWSILAGAGTMLRKGKSEKTNGFESNILEYLADTY